jgi:hypothetical protein
MDLTNQTGLPAFLMRAVIDEQRIASAVFARITYDLRPDGTLARRGEQTWIVSRPPWDGPQGPMPSDEVFYRGGVDVFVFGKAWTHRGRPAPASPLRVKVGRTFDHKIFVFGDRVWQGRGRWLTASAPKPFTSMPLDLAHAYGGKLLWDGLEVSHPSNHLGKGFARDAQDAAGKALPNLENPDQLMRAWNDTPDPVGVAVRPSSFEPHFRATVTFDEKGILRRLSPRFFNAAFPGMIAERVEPGDPVTLEGFSPDGPLRFVIPPAPLAVDLGIGGARMRRVMPVDQIGVETEERRVFIAYRFPFRYTIVPRQTRFCVLRETAQARV